MGKESLHISEERVGETIRIIRAGIKSKPPRIRRETAAILLRWCREEEKYLKDTMFKEFWP